MASSADMVIAIIGVLLVLQPRTAMGDIPSPLLPPVIGGNICKAVECGKGTCKPSGSSSFQFECVCDAGWKQTQSDHDDKYAYLPCVIPDCNLDYTCQENRPLPSPSNLSVLDPCYWTNCGRGTCKTAPSTLFAPTCECSQGYSNLFNTPSFPCVKPCNLDYTCQENRPLPSPSNLSILDPCYWTNCGRGTCKTAPSTQFAPTCECSEGYSNLFNTPSFPCVKPCGIGGDCSSLGLDLKNKSASTTSNLADNGSTLSGGSLGWMVISMALLIPFMFK